MSNYRNIRSRTRTTVRVPEHSRLVVEVLEDRLPPGQMGLGSMAISLLAPVL